jgi:hypothetical protein
MPAVMLFLQFSTFFVKKQKLSAIQFERQKGAMKLNYLKTNKGEVIKCQHHLHHTTIKRDLIPITGKHPVRRTIILHRAGRKRIPGLQKNSAMSAKANNPHTH